MSIAFSYDPSVGGDFDEKVATQKLLCDEKFPNGRFPDNFTKFDENFQNKNCTTEDVTNVERQLSARRSTNQQVFNAGNSSTVKGIKKPYDAHRKRYLTQYLEDIKKLPMYKTLMDAGETQKMVPGFMCNLFYEADSLERNKSKSIIFPHQKVARDHMRKVAESANPHVFLLWHGMGLGKTETIAHITTEMVSFKPQKQESNFTVAGPKSKRRRDTPIPTSKKDMTETTDGEEGQEMNKRLKNTLEEDTAETTDGEEGQEIKRLNNTLEEDTAETTDGKNKYITYYFNQVAGTGSCDKYIREMVNYTDEFKSRDDITADKIKEKLSYFAEQSRVGNIMSRFADKRLICYKDNTDINDALGKLTAIWEKDKDKLNNSAKFKEKFEKTTGIFIVLDEFHNLYKDGNIKKGLIKIIEEMRAFISNVKVLCSSGTPFSTNSEFKQFEVFCKNILGIGKEKLTRAHLSISKCETLPPAISAAIDYESIYSSNKFTGKDSANGIMVGEFPEFREMFSSIAKNNLQKHLIIIPDLTVKPPQEDAGLLEPENSAWSIFSGKSGNIDNENTQQNVNLYNKTI